MEYKDLLKKYVGHLFITGIPTRPGSIMLPFYHSIIPLVPIDKYSFSRHWQSPFPTLHLLYPFRPISSRPLAISPPVFLKRITNITHVSTSPTVYPSPGLRFLINFNLNHLVHLHNGNCPRIAKIDQIKNKGECGGRANTRFAPTKGFRAEVGVRPDFVFTRSSPGVLRQPARVHPTFPDSLPGAKPVSAPATQPAAPGNSNMLITERLKGPKQFHSTRVFSSLTLHHFNRAETLNRTFHLVSNRYFDNRAPGYERANAVHGSELIEHRRTKKPGNTNGFRNDGIMQHKKVRIAGNKPGALKLHYLNPQPAAARSSSAPEENPPPAQTRSRLQHFSFDASQSHDPRSYNRALPGVPDIPQTNKMNIDLDHLTNRLYTMLERKIKIEKEMRGL